jgi:LysR family transcriptional regulator, low CO2-responsive transcriptional regulator
MDERLLLEADAVHAFGVFAQHRNFTRAAAALHISQPSLHVKITKLAAGLGVELYQRAGRELVLTTAGQRLAAYASDVGRRAEEFLRDLQHAPATLSLAAGRAALLWVIGDAIRAVAAQGHRLQVITADRDSALGALASGQVDVAVLGYDPPPRHVQAAQLAAYPQMLVVDSGHRLARRARLRLRDLAGLDLIVPPAGRPHRRALERALLDAGVSWQAVAEADGWDLLVHLAALSMGATVVNGCVPVPDGMTGIPISDLPTVRYWAAWRPQRHPRPPDLVRYL